MSETPTTIIQRRANLAYVIDDDANVQEFVSRILAELGLNVAGFLSCKDALASMHAGHPAIIFLDVALRNSDAYDVIRGLKECDYRGVVHLMSGGRPWLLQAIASLSKRHGITLSAALEKPVKREAIVKAIASLDEPASSGMQMAGLPKG